MARQLEQLPGVTLTRSAKPYAPANRYYLRGRQCRCAPKAPSHTLKSCPGPKSAAIVRPDPTRPRYDASSMFIAALDDQGSPSVGRFASASNTLTGSAWLMAQTPAPGSAVRCQLSPVAMMQDEPCGEDRRIVQLPLVEVNNSVSRPLPDNPTDSCFSS